MFTETTFSHPGLDRVCSIIGTHLRQRQVFAGLVARLPAGQPVGRSQQRVAEEFDLQAAGTAAATCAGRPIPSIPAAWSRS